MNGIVRILAGLLIPCLLLGQKGTTQKTVQEQLGYDPDAKLLIVHADDLGVAHSENRASIKVLENGGVNSASIMVPCPWFLEIAAYAKTYNFRDFGVHLTLNSEWKNYKWGPVSGRNTVPSMVDENGYFFDNTSEVGEKGKADEVMLELDNQVQMAIANHIDVTHLDTHMGAVLSKKEFFKAYLKVGNKYQLPVLLAKNIPWVNDADILSLIHDGNQVVVDQVFGAGPQDFDSGMATYYKNVLDQLEPGLNVLLIHLAFNDTEMKAVTKDHSYWGAAWRQADFYFFSGKGFQLALEKNNIHLVTWMEIRDKIIRSQ